jgi:CheY-like chemotaxis protein
LPFHTLGSTILLMSPQVDVLLVEDDDFDSKAAQRALSRHPQVGQVHVVVDGEAALACLKDPNSVGPTVGMVVLDLGLPGISGLEVLQTLKRDAALAHLPVIVLSDNSDPQDLLEVYRNGACAFLRKPDSVEGYKDALDGVMRFWLLASWPQPTS